MKLNPNRKPEQMKIAYAIIGINGKFTPDMMGRMVYTTKAKAKEVARSWGIPSNVVKVRIENLDETLTPTTSNK